MAASFAAGAIAGWAIAIPVGAIAILIVETGIRHGFQAAAAAGAGAVSADGIFAALAAIGGTALAALTVPVERPLRIIAIGAPLGIGLRGLALTTIGSRDVPVGTVVPARALGTYLRFLGLTLLNPATVVYFAALIPALPDLGRGPGERAGFVIGAFLASLSWQLILASISALAHHRLPPRLRVGISVFGNTLICGFAILLALQL